MSSKMKRILIGSVVTVVVVYVLDDLSARLGIPAREQFSTITINKYFYVNEKYNKFSYEPNGSYQARCVNALLPHSGSQPCWYVKKHKSEITEVN